MPADFTTFQDTSLAVGAIPTQVNFTTPNVDQGRNCNLSFRVDPILSSTNSVTLLVEINSNTVLQQTFDTEPQRVWQENFPGSFLDSLNNTLQLTKVGGNGDVSVSDFMVNFKV